LADILVVFPDPCSADWDAMEPRGRGRFCGGCGKVVHDLAQHTPEEAAALLNAPEGSPCVRAQPAPDGRVRTRGGGRRRRVLAAVASPAVLAALATSAAASPGTGAIVGHVAVNGASAQVVAVRGAVRRSAAIGPDGAYHLGGLPPGAYRLTFREATGANWTVRGVMVRAGAVAVRNSGDPHAQIPPPPLMGLPPIQPPTKAPVGEAHTLPAPEPSASGANPS
jgi:hypothetical protein